MATQADYEAEFRRGIGKVLRELRHERGLGQEELAEASRLHVNHISFLERGMRVPSLLVVFQLAAALELSPTELIARIEAQVGPVPWCADPTAN